ncbi:hypothetical protein PLANTIT3_50343 [Plantibacter sp. T3]|nr:hypothetical protein PLANTIT3_50343 [Plantibacter sp. T3]
MLSSLCVTRCLSRCRFTLRLSAPKTQLAAARARMGRFGVDVKGPGIDRYGA